jgi:hypothetical protein
MQVNEFSDSKVKFYKIFANLRKMTLSLSIGILFLYPVYLTMVTFLINFSYTIYSIKFASYKEKHISYLSNI